MFVLFFLGTNVLLAQKKVSGIVKEADTNEPLIGATVVVKGTTNGVITDLDGHYAIKVNTNEVRRGIPVKWSTGMSKNP